MQSERRTTISVDAVDAEDQKYTSPRVTAVPTNSEPTAVKGFESPASAQSVEDGAAACTQFLVLPKNPSSSDAFTTPTNREQQDGGSTAKWEKAQRHMQAPKKRDELLSGEKERANRAYDPDNLSVREFRLDSGRNSDSGGSTDNSSTSERDERQEALNQMRNEWGAFTDRIMRVQVQNNSLNLPRM